MSKMQRMDLINSYSAYLLDDCRKIQQPHGIKNCS
ncbi:unnamed protein product [Arabidopsis halleri]